MEELTIYANTASRPVPKVDTESEKITVFTNSTLPLFRRLQLFSATHQSDGMHFNLTSPRLHVSGEILPRGVLQALCSLKCRA